MSNTRKTVFILLTASLTALTVTFPQISLNAVSESLLMWAKAVVPTLFPFFFLSKLLVELGGLDGLSHLLQRPIKWLFKAPEAGSTAFILSLLCGYPVGAKTADDLFEKGRVNINGCYKLATFCSTASPIFVMATVGVAFLGSQRAGLIIYSSHLIATILCGLIFRNSFYTKEVELNTLDKNRLRNENIISKTMTSSLSSTLTVGGYIVMFSVVAAFVERFLDNIATPKQITAFVCGLLEMTKGCQMVSCYCTPMVATVLSCTIVSFGGVCVFMQTLSMYEKSRLKGGFLLMFKAVQGAVSTLICYLLSILFL